MVIRRSPLATNAPSRKCAACTAPATRDRTSTRSTASRRPENSSQRATLRCSTVATDTGTGAGVAMAALLECRLLVGTTTAAVPAAAIAKPTPAPSNERRNDRLFMENAPSLTPRRKDERGGLGSTPAPLCAAPPRPCPAHGLF